MIGNEVRIASKQHDDWQIVPNPGGPLIENPSALKTPAMRAALAPLYTLQKERRKNWQQHKKTNESS
ncbi:hypothetical protein GCM10023261_05270 [Bartonella jaculi]|uniref:Uncharacterized protein n=1 Tax=Bartonella jaculi TaxID=686226 RepID=A0ABP9N647_9HYPH